ncbi:MAG: hypothetical protein ABH865_06130 [Candidatus Omnitrophota bacterium]|nr:hypothetical protein [Candidatus Omnitrophota bacterium]
MKTLLIHASFGEGHKKAALALQDYLNAPCEDLLNFCPRFIRRIYISGYTGVTDHLPWIWQLFFVTTRSKILDHILAIGHKIIFSSFFSFLTKEKPHVIVSTHFFPFPFLAQLKQKLNLRIISIVTDLRVHPLWAHPAVDYHIVATAETKQDLINLGIPSEKIIYGYVPLREGFLKSEDSARLREKFSLDNKPCILFISSMRGKFPYLEEIIPELAGAFNIFIIYGNNHNLKNRIQQLNLSSVRLIGFSESIWELFDLASIIVTKPGGLTIFEGLYKKKFFVFTHFIPGQEEENMDLLIRYKVGSFARSAGELDSAIRFFKDVKNRDESYPLRVADVRDILKSLIERFEHLPPEASRISTAKFI